jgi:hypothetical protein
VAAFSVAVATAAGKISRMATSSASSGKPASGRATNGVGFFGMA